MMNGGSGTHHHHHASHTMPRHPASMSMTQADTTVPRRPPLQLQTVARRSAAAQAAQSTRPTSWHVADANNWNNSSAGDPGANGINGVEKCGSSGSGSHGSGNAPPPPLPPPNSNSLIEAKLQALQKAAVAIATGPGSIIAEDGKIAKALNLPAFAKSVKNSYVVSPSRKHPVSGLYAVTELGKPPTGVRKMTAGPNGGVFPPHNSNGTTNNAGQSKLAHPNNPSSLTNGKTSFGVVP